MFDEKIDRFIIAHEGKTKEGKPIKIIGDLHRCIKCRINFSALPKCIICCAIEEKEVKLGRRLTKKEFNEWMIMLTRWNAHEELLRL